MRIYRFNHDTKAKLLADVEDDHHPISSDFHGQSKIKGWTTISLETLYKKSYKDFPKYHIGKPVVSKRVKEMMEKRVY